MNIDIKRYGFLRDKREVNIYSLVNSKGVSVDVIDYGCIITNILVPDKNNNYSDVVLGFDNLKDYEERNQFFGSIVGRYANRIEKGLLNINNTTYYLAKNDGENHLHGGKTGFDKVLWDSKIINYKNQQALELKYTSIDGEENYPGNLYLKVIYYLTENNELVLEYHAESDQDTVCNLSNHSYFNLKGHNSGDISSHYLRILANKIAMIDKNCLANGNILEINDSPFDFLQYRNILKNIDSGHEQIRKARGYDHNFILNNYDGKLRLAAELYESSSRRKMEVYTTKPGLQFYTANSLETMINCKNNASYFKRSGLCLETQYFPNSIIHKHFPSPILRKGERYSHTTVYKFSVKDEK